MYCLLVSVINWCSLDPEPPDLVLRSGPGSYKPAGSSSWPVLGPCRPAGSGSWAVLGPCRPARSGS